MAFINAFETELAGKNRQGLHRMGRSLNQGRQGDPFNYGTAGPPDLENQADQREMLLRLMNLAGVNKVEREVLFAYYWDGTPQAEIARQRGITRQRVGQHVRGAVFKMREAACRVNGLTPSTLSAILVLNQTNGDEVPQQKEEK